jgi:1-acyl-sn-glycerol-3-phosphate acyltransferase
MSTFVLTSTDAPSGLQKFAIAALRLCGWSVLFAPLPGPRGVAIVYPHTSNWDFFFGLLAKWAIGVPFHWLGKPSLFRWGLGSFMRAVGGEPVERGGSTGAIARLAKRIQDADEYWLALAPEGTRQFRPQWRSGFYHIALAARAPVGIVCIDYRARQVRFVEHVTLTGNLAADLAAIRAKYPPGAGFHPRLESPIVFGGPETASAANGDAVQSKERSAHD